MSILAFSVPIVRIYAFMHPPDLSRKDGSGVGVGGEGNSLYGLNGNVRPDRVWFLEWGIDFNTFCLKQGIANGLTRISLDVFLYKSLTTKKKIGSNRRMF